MVRPNLDQLDPDNDTNLKSGPDFETYEIPPTFLNELYEAAALNTTELVDEPNTFKEVRSSPNSAKWLEAMQLELDELKRQNTWDLVPHIKGTKVLKARWVLRTKPNPLDPTKPKYKARWVAKGFQQRFGIDFNETYANTVNPISYRLLLYLAAKLNWEIDQWDITSVYPNASITKKIYTIQPIGFEDAENPTYICRLNKALYGLKQSGREWESFLKGLLAKANIHPTKSDHSIYVSTDTSNNNILIIITYVDDMLVLSPNRANIKQLYTILNKTVKVKDLGPAKTFLGIDIIRDRSQGHISLSQLNYTKKILSKFRRKTRPKHTSNPCQIGIKLDQNTEEPDIDFTRQFQKELGSLMYLMTKTRPDLAYPVGLAARFMSNPNLEHYKALDRIWNYLEDHQDLGLTFKSDPNLESINLIGYTDSDWGGDLGTRRSTTGYIFLLNSNNRNSIVSWNSRLQRTVALSSCEAEYMAFKDAIKERLFIRNLISEIPTLQGFISPVNTIYTDSKSAIDLTKNPVFHSRTKHIDIQYHFIREAYTNKLIDLVYIPTNKQLADPLTKPLDNAKFNRFIVDIGLKHL